MLYKLSNEQIDHNIFKNPLACYRGVPFWSWNCRITKQMIDEQLQYFQEMGFGGIHIHVRVGLQNQYMGDEFLNLVRYCNEKAKSLGMLCWLYDEDRYASGCAGGEVTKTIKYRARHLCLTTRRRTDLMENYEEFQILQEENVKVQGCLLKVYDIVLKEGYLTSARMIEPDAAALGKKWFLYEELEQETPWYNNQTYVDTMNDEAILRFIHHTHEKYASVLQDEFGGNIPAIFTDEPHITGCKIPEYADSEEDITLPFTEQMPVTYGNLSNMDFFEVIPRVVWNQEGNEFSRERYYFFETCCQLFTTSYCKQIKDWCEEHGLLSTGHILSEETLEGQARCVGDAMRCYTEFQLPGIDNLCDYREFSAAKQVSSIAHQMKREGALSELYGVTQWDFDFEGYKLAGDWQAALGITTRVPHLAWASMEGEAKRDYPAVIGWQSPWYKEYHYIEEHFARVNYCLTRGEPDVHIAVIHPVESMWVLQGPTDQMGDKRDQLERDFQNVTEWLLTGGLDFDYISEAILEREATTVKQDGFVCGAMRYDVVVIPNCVILRKSTVEQLIEFQEQGGNVIIYGKENAFQISDSESYRVHAIKGTARCVYGKANLLEALEPWRQIDIRGVDGKRRDIYLHQFRKEGSHKWLFVAQAYKGIRTRTRSTWDRRALHEAERIQLRIKGRWAVEQFDTLSGETMGIESEIQNTDTIISYPMYGDDSLLLHLSPPVSEGKEGKNDRSERVHDSEIISVEKVDEPVMYTLDEPNVLLLDKFFYSFDGEEESGCEELLKIDNKIRTKLGYPLRVESVEQPYVRKSDIRNHRVRLRAVFTSEIEITDCKLALEERRYSQAFLNGQRIDMCPRGYYVDKAIETVALPLIQKGENELIIEMQYGPGTNLEWMYLLGEFGVQVHGSEAAIISKPARIYWGDYVHQGFPFYTGNMTYYVKVNQKENRSIRLRIPYFSGAAVKVECADFEKLVAFLPYDCELKGLPIGENIIRIICLGNRYNGFGQLHMIGDNLTWVGPDSWRTEAESWTDTYRLKEMGILSEPFITEVMC